MYYKDILGGWVGVYVTEPAVKRSNPEFTVACLFHSAETAADCLNFGRLFPSSNTLSKFLCLLFSLVRGRWTYNLCPSASRKFSRQSVKKEMILSLVLARPYIILVGIGTDHSKKVSTYQDKSWDIFTDLPFYCTQGVCNLWIRGCLHGSA